MLNPRAASETNRTKGTPIYKQLLHTSALSGMATLVKILTGMLSLKIVALYTGPQGVAILGQFMALVNIFAVIAGGGITIGVIKYVAEYASSADLANFLASASVYTLFFSVLTLLGGFIFSTVLSTWILGTDEYAYLIRWLSVAQLFIAMHLLLCAIINGFSKIRILVSITILSSLISLILISVIAIYFKLKGTLFAYVASQGLAIGISLALCYRQQWFKLLFSMRAKARHLLNLSRYSLMTIVSALTVPVAQILVRNDLNDLFGWEAVGYWQAVLRLSDAYLLFVTTALTAYYLPRLAQLHTLAALKQEIGQSYKILMPVMALILIIIYIARDLIIHVLYSDSFAPASNLFAYQLLGDLFRVAGWLFTYLLLAKSWTKMYISTEIILSILFVAISHFFARHYGLVGITYAFALAYFLYWLLMASVAIIYFKKEQQLCPLISPL